MMDVLVLGGGFTGLSAAWHLHRRGLHVEVWEAAPELGGWVQTLPWLGPSGEPGWIETGPQMLRMHRGCALERLLDALGLPRRPPPPRGPRWLLDRDGWHAWPSGLGWVTTRRLTWLQKARLLLEPFAPAAEDGETLADLAARRLGTAFATRLWPAMVAGLLGADPAHVEAGALPALVRADRQGGFAWAALRQGPHTRCLLEGGMGGLIQALTHALPSVHPGRPAVALAADGSGWQVHHPEGVAQAKHVVLALPPHAAAPLVAPGMPQVAEELEAMASTSLEVVHSRHRPAWRVRGDGVLRVHPELGMPLLGATAQGWEEGLQVRAYFRGGAREGVEAHWRGLGQAFQSHTIEAPRALPLAHPGHGRKVASVAQALPTGLSWIGAWRWAPGLAELAEAVERWAGALRIS